jgi:hypothetical protein
VNAKSTNSSARGLPASHSGTALKIYEHRAGSPRNVRFSLRHRLYHKPALKTSAKKTYDHPACPPRNGLASSPHQRFVASGPFQSQQLLPCVRVTTAENNGVSTRVSRTFDIPHWLQIRRSGFDSRRYHIFRQVVGLELGPLSLVRITEEVLEWRNSGSGSRKSRLTAAWIRFADQATPSIQVGTNFADMRRSLGRYSSLRTKATEFIF